MQEVETHAILSEFELNLLPENQLSVVLQIERDINYQLSDGIDDYQNLEEFTRIHEYLNRSQDYCFPACLENRAFVSYHFVSV